jgi:glycosyltransferase involved in cell wall biosynthesis
MTAGGSERSTQELAEGLVEAGHQVLVVTLVPPGREGIPGSPGREKVNGVEIVRVTSRGVVPIVPGAPRRAWLAKRLWRIAEANRPVVNRKVVEQLDRFHPDVVHTSLVLGFGGGVWRAARRYPLVHTIRDYYLVCARAAPRRGGVNCTNQCATCRIATAPMRRATRHLDLATGVSKDIVDRHRRWRSVARGLRLEVVYNRPPALTMPEQVVRNDDRRIVGYLGRLAPEKGIGVLIEAIALIEDRNVQLVVAGSGSGEEEAQIRRAAGRDPRISFIGLQDPRLFFATVDVVAVPSQWYEPFGRAAFEAALAGKPVAVSDVGGLAEAVAGYPGLVTVADPSDPAQWRSALLSALGMSATTQASWKPDHDDPARRFAELYREIVGIRGPTHS